MTPRSNGSIVRMHPLVSDGDGGGALLTCSTTKSSKFISSPSSEKRGVDCRRTGAAGATGAARAIGKMSSRLIASPSSENREVCR